VSPKYPTTVGDVTFGWADITAITTGLFHVPGEDRRLAGYHTVFNPNFPQSFRVDLPRAGWYEVRVAAGLLSTQINENSEEAGLWAGSVWLYDGLADRTIVRPLLYAPVGWIGSADGVFRITEDWLAHDAPAVAFFAEYVVIEVRPPKPVSPADAPVFGGAPLAHLHVLERDPAFWGVSGSVAAALPRRSSLARGLLEVSGVAAGSRSAPEIQGAGALSITGNGAAAAPTRSLLVAGSMLIHGAASAGLPRLRPAFSIQLAMSGSAEANVAGFATIGTISPDSATAIGGGWYLWVDPSTGKLRIKFGLPAYVTDGQPALG
jgi:hypothetical protein